MANLSFHPASIVIDDGTVWKNYVTSKVFDLVVHFETQTFHISPMFNFESIKVCSE